MKPIKLTADQFKEVEPLIEKLRRAKSNADIFLEEYHEAKDKFWGKIHELIPETANEGSLKYDGETKEIVQT